MKATPASPTMVAVVTPDPTSFASPSAGSRLPTRVGGLETALLGVPHDSTGIGAARTTLHGAGRVRMRTVTSRTELRSKQTNGRVWPWQATDCDRHLGVAAGEDARRRAGPDSRREAGDEADRTLA